MSDGIDLVYESIEEQHAQESAVTRRRLVQGAAATLGGMGLLAAPFAGTAKAANDTQTILNVAATAEVLATIVNTVGAEQVSLDAVTQRNVQRRRARGAHPLHAGSTTSAAGPLTKKIWVPDAVFASATGLLSTLEVGDQIFVNAYLIATKTFGNAGNGRPRRRRGRVHGRRGRASRARAPVARQARQRPGVHEVQQEGDRARRPERGPGRASRTSSSPSAQLQAAGFGFGEPGASPGQFYDFGDVAPRTPDDPDLNTRNPQTGSSA